MFRRPNRTIVPEYLPPRGLSLLAAAELLGDGKRAIAAQLVDLAVRRVVSIAPIDKKRKRGKGYVVTLLSAADLGPDESDFVDALFSSRTAGSRLTIRPHRNGDLSRRLRVPHKRAVARLILANLARERTWWERSPWGAKPVVPAQAAFPLVDHLWGNHDYISFAEKDRLAFGQSPQGAQLRLEASTAQEALLLSEKLLPIAVLFGLEKEWMRELGVQYAAAEQTTPGVDLMLEATGDLLGALVDLEVLEGVEGIAHFASDLDALESVGTAVEAVDALDGVGAIFGGIAEVFFSGL